MAGLVKYLQKKAQSPKTGLELSKRFQNVLDRKYGSLCASIELQNNFQLHLSFELGLYENNNASDTYSTIEFPYVPTVDRLSEVYWGSGPEALFFSNRSSSKLRRSWKIFCSSISTRKDQYFRSSTFWKCLQSSRMDFGGCAFFFVNI